jgi:4-amino-4-deoxy-L-arabinose transferase-like glycosyltransferase
MKILRNPLFWILLAGGIIRLLSLQPVHSNGYTSDESEYIRVAKTLEEGKEFIDSNGEYSTRAPLFPFWLSGVFRIAGEGLTIPLILNCLLGVFLIYLLYSLCLEMTGLQTESLIAAGAVAASPGLITYSVLLQSETLSLMFFLTALLFAFRFTKSSSILDAVVVGICCGFAALTRAVFLGYFPALLLLMWFMRQKKNIPAPRPLVAAAILFVMVLGPWTIRNYSLHHRIIPVSSGGGNSLLTGNNPFATGTWRAEPGFSEWFRQQAAENGVADVDALSETERSSLAGTIAVEYMMSHPLDIMSLMVKKAHILLIYPVTGIETSSAGQGMAVIFDYFFYVVSAAGLLWLRKRRESMILITGTACYFIILHLILHAESRFRLPVVLPLCIFAGVGVKLLFDKKQLPGFFRQNKKAISISFAVITAIYGYSAWLHLQGTI